VSAKGSDGAILCRASAAQRRMWELAQAEPASSLYNVPVAVWLEGKLDSGALARALNEVVSRHPALRTTFRLSSGPLLQVVSPNITIPVPLATLEGPDVRAQAHRLAEREAQRAFDLAEGPLLRALLLRLQADHHVFILTLHHACCDAWSLRILFRELGSIYGACVQERSAPLAAPAEPYARFAEWQAERLNRGEFQSQLEYWSGQLSGRPPSLELGVRTDPRPTKHRGRAGSYRFDLPAELMEQLGALARSARTTRYMALLAVFQAVLCLRCGVDDVWVGTPIAGRVRREYEDSIGPFVNTLVLRTDLAGDPSFRALLRRVRKVALAAYGRQELPFEELASRIYPGGDPDRTPLFQVWFVLRDHLTPWSRPELALAGLITRPLEIGAVEARFDLKLDITDLPQRASGLFEFNMDVLDYDSVALIARQFEALLRYFIERPDDRLSAGIEELNAAERLLARTRF
jgi:hypothetical protein